MIHVTTVGPAKNVAAVRCPKAGALKAIQNGLSFVGLDGKETCLFIEGPADLARLIVDMLETFTPDGMNHELPEARKLLGEYVARILAGTAGGGTVRPKMYRAGRELVTPNDDTEPKDTERRQ